MMSLKVQLYSFLYSFVCGVFIYLVTYFSKKILFYSFGWSKIISSFIFCLDISLLYFIGLKFINEGEVHIYFLALIILGIGCGYLLVDKFLKK